MGRLLVDSGFRKKITAVFMIGYFISFLRNRLLYAEKEERDYQNLVIAFVEGQIRSTLSGLYLDAFGETLPELSHESGTNSLSSSLDAIFEIISEKIQRGGESFLEISFFCGGCLSISDFGHSIPVDLKMYEQIIFNLLNSLGLKYPFDDLRKMLRELNDCDLQVRRGSRDQLFFLICGNLSPHKKIYHIQTLFEANYFYRNSVCA
ncbi:MAG: hypothetical protein WC061_01670 [Melioribacteraceae bacterium]